LKKEKTNDKQYTIHKYIKNVSPQLREHYGHHKQYTPKQVKQTISDLGYSSAYDCYALAMYCSHDDFTEYHMNIGESCDYDLMRGEISDTFSSLFQNETTLDASDVIEISDRIDSTEEIAESDVWRSNMTDLDTIDDSDYISWNDSGSDSDPSSDFSSDSDFDGGGSDFSSD
jgi:hypothetical protein